MSLLKSIFFKVAPSSLINSLRKRHYLKRFKNLDGSEEPEMQVIKQLVKKGSAVLDVGANFGVYSKLLSGLVGPEGKVYAFEPIPDVQGFLSHNLKKSSISNVELLPFALADYSGEAHFHLPKFSHSGVNYYEGHLTEKNGDIKVQVRSLDELNLKEKVGFMKCDVEGAELEMLKGSENVLRKDKPIIMLEINGSLEEGKAPQVLAFLLNLDYTIKYFDGADLTQEAKNHSGVNYFFFPVE